MFGAGLGWHGKCPQPRSAYAPVFCFLRGYTGRAGGGVRETLSRYKRPVSLCKGTKENLRRLFSGA